MTALQLCIHCLLQPLQLFCLSAAPSILAVFTHDWSHEAQVDSC